MRPVFKIGIAAVAGALALSGLVIAAESGIVREWVVQFCCYGLFAMSLNLMVGYSGMLAFGHAAFFGLGSYCFCILLQGGAVGIPAASLLTVLFVGMVAAVCGFVSVRLEGIFFSFITLATQMLLYSVALAWSGLTGGEQGLIGGIPRAPFLGIDLANPRHLYGTSIAVTVLCTIAMAVIVASPFGAAMRMIRDNPQRATFVGLNVVAYRLSMFVVASAFAGIAGILMALHVSGAYPNFMYWTLSGEGLFMIVLGGSTLFLGPLVGAALLVVLNGILNTWHAPHGIVLGVIILALVLGLKKGLLEWVLERFPRHKWRKGVRVAPGAPAESVVGS